LVDYNLVRGRFVKDDWVEQGGVLVADLHVAVRDCIVDVEVRTCPVAHCVGVVHWRLDVQVVSYQDVRRMGSSLDDQDNRDDPYQVVDVLLSMVDVIQENLVHVRLALVHEIVVTGSEGVDSTWVSLVPVHHQGHLDAVQSFDHLFAYLSCYFRPIFDLVSRPIFPGR